MLAQRQIGDPTTRSQRHAPFFAIHVLPLIAAALLVSSTAGAVDSGKTEKGTTMAVVDFDYRDTSGEPRDQRQVHKARLKTFMAALRRDLAARGKTMVSLNCDPAPCSVERPAADLLRAAREAGAGIVLVGTIQKVSTLIQNAKAEAIDTGTERIVLDRPFTFRGDNDESWRHAEAFISRQLAAVRQEGGKSFRPRRRPTAVRYAAWARPTLSSSRRMWVTSSWLIACPMPG